MSVLVAEEGITSLVAGGASDRLVVIPRPRRRRGRGWGHLEADRVVDALVTAGPDAVVLARSGDVDPDAAALPELGRMMGHVVVRLPGEPIVAAWAVAVATHPDFQGGGLVKRLEALVGVASASESLPRRVISAGTPAVPALRPGVLSKWAACAWRACAHCSGGGPAGGACGRCGAAGVAVTS